MNALSVRAEVRVAVEWYPCWLSWVGAATSCLRALGARCDLTDVAGFSGYAFVLSIHQELCPSGPTVFDWRELLPGIRYLGREAAEHHGPGHEATAADCQRLFELVAEEIGAGRPCVLNGAYAPEFAAVIGVADGCYRVRSFRETIGQEQPPIPLDQLDAPGGLYAAFFRETTGATPESGDRWAVAHAVGLLRGSGWKWRPAEVYTLGLAAYDAWIDALCEGRPHGFGPRYNAQCYAAGRAHARGFLERVAARQPALAETLGHAVTAYGRAAGAMGEVARLFPFSFDQKPLDGECLARGAAQLALAREAETEAVAALEAALDEWPEE